MGLRDDIYTLEARREAGVDVDQELAIAYARMCIRKSSKNLVWKWFDRLASLLDQANRASELTNAAGGIDPQDIGVWDAQESIRVWLVEQG